MRIHTALAGLALAAVATSAHAADPRVIEPLDFGASAFKPAIHDWTGPYIGVHAGYGWSTHTTDFFVGAGPVPAATGSTSNSRGVWGVQAGYDADLDGLMWGIEVDFSYIGDRAAHTLAGFSPDVRMDWVSSARLKLGVTWDAFMIYGTGGAAMSEVRMRELNTGWSTEDYRFGWVAGAGAEVSLTPEWSLRGEWLYYDFGKDRNNIILAGAPTPGIRHDMNMHTVRAGLNYRFAP